MLRKAPLWLSIGLALFLAACFSKEPEQRKAYIEFLQSRIIDNKDETTFPAMTSRQEEAFGPYVDSFKIMATFFDGMNERTGVGRNATKSPMSLPGAPELIADPTLLDKFSASFLQRARETKILVDTADTAKARLQLPDDLKAVYDKAYDRTVSKRGRDWANLEPQWTGVTDQMKKLVAFVRQNQSKIQVQGSGLLTDDPAILAQMQGILKDLYARQDALNKAFDAL
ncbi:DUF3053 domain-containing protein [Labrys sp. KNU-23]|uniref:DUF3053 family protein n=1 Tax=Labrys sp. KNU-23 TaxID=2789216 RepID=UPI0011EEE79E|nr:DUF3053 family protein [Labrys sp. KNU-23]QEN89787.1 DUF3053 domain-containing protein [Labrys sp. KNU-23]